MKQFSYEEALEFLAARTNLEMLVGFSPQGMEGRLDVLRRLLVCWGHPEEKYRTVHVAGTKGKGSTCVLLEAVLLEEGLRVGRYASPHLYSPRERLMIDGIPCSEEDWAELTFELIERIRQFDPALPEKLTFFEWTTLMAFVYFAKKGVDVAIFEVGMGGRWDATNVCRPELTIVTSISFDHIEQLGPTLADIAAEKGGIIKPGVPLLSTVRRPEAQGVLRRIALERGAPCFFLGQAFKVLPADPPGCFHFQTVPKRFPVQYAVDSLSVSLRGSHQIRNAAMAIAAAILLHAKTKREPLDARFIRQGLNKAYLPARIEIFQNPAGGPTFVFDGAHNRSSIRAFIKTLRETFPDQRLLLVFGISLGKDAEGMLTDILRYFSVLILTQHPSNPRRFPPQGLKTILSSLQGAPREIQEEFLTSAMIDSSLMEDSVMLGLDGQFLFHAARLDDPPPEAEEPSLKVQVVEDCFEALDRCLALATPDDVVCVSGSMFLAAVLRQYYLEGGG